jgi:hypothetical protein
MFGEREQIPLRPAFFTIILPRFSAEVEVRLVGPTVFVAVVEDAGGDKFRAAVDELDSLLRQIFSDICDFHFFIGYL